MELIRGPHNLQEHHRGCAITIGNFDGLHRGHQALIGRTRELALRHGVPCAVLTFEPTPREFFSPGNAPPRIHTFRGKLAELAKMGVDRLVVTRFSRQLSACPPEDFIDELLVRRLGVRALVVGDDFRYGRRREGSAELLRARARRHGFEVDTLDSVISEDGERCSSTAVREALAVPDLARAARLLGRPYTIRGRVRRGLQLGRRLGMPTANVHLQRPMALRQGVYAVRASCEGRLWDGVANLGVRPTLGLTQCLLETHVFGEAGALYGCDMEVEFHAYLRPELRFDSLDELAARMQQDAAQARELLAAAG